jgi:hypothetical protein
MSKKVRIAISCVLVAVAFVFGIVTFSKLNGNDTKQAIAEDPAVYFTDAQGRVDIFSIGNDDGATLVESFGKSGFVDDVAVPEIDLGVEDLVKKSDID